MSYYGMGFEPTAEEVLAAEKARRAAVREAPRLMRGIIREHQYTLADAGVTARVDLQVRNGVRRYWLTFEGEAFVSSPIMLDTSNGVVWIRKALHESSRLQPDGDAWLTAREIMDWVRYETLILDYLLENFDPVPGSENVLSLKAARAAR